MLFGTNARETVLITKPRHHTTRYKVSPKGVDKENTESQVGSVTQGFAMLILRIYSPNFGNVLKQRVFNEEVPIIFSNRIYRKATNLILQMLKYLHSFLIIAWLWRSEPVETCFSYAYTLIDNQNVCLCQVLIYLVLLLWVEHNCFRYNVFWPRSSGDGNHRSILNFYTTTTCMVLYYTVPAFWCNELRALPAVAEGT